MAIYLLPFWKFRISFKTNKKKTTKAKKNFIQIDNIPTVFLSTTQTYHTTIVFKLICILRRHIFTVLWHPWGPISYRRSDFLWTM